MAAQTTRAKGKLYQGYGGEFVSEVSYQIHEGVHKEWWGELTLVDNIRVPDGDKYTLELEDKRRGKCSLKRRVNKAVILVPPRYFYLIRGTSLLKQGTK